MPTFLKTCEAIGNDEFKKWERDRQMDGLRSRGIYKSYLTSAPTNFITISSIQWAIYNTLLERIPKHLLTEELLMTPDGEGLTAIHTAARTVSCHLLPSGVLSEHSLEKLLQTKKYLLQEDDHKTLLCWIENEIELKKLKKDLKALSYPSLE